MKKKTPVLDFYPFFVWRIKNRLSKLREFAENVLKDRSADDDRMDLVYYLLKQDKKTGRQLTRSEMKIEMSQFIASGHETTGHSMGEA